MDRINGAGHVNRRFVTEDAATSRPPTEVTDTWLNGIQEEIAAVIEGAGVVLSSASNTQLLAALNTLFTKKTGATGLIRSLTLAGGGIVCEWGDVVNAATVGGIEFGFSYNANINLATGAWLGRDIAGPCFLRKLNDTGVSEEIWFAPTAAAGVVPAWTCVNVIDPSGVSNTNISGKNLLVNGNFDTWQKGGGPFVNWTFGAAYATGDYGYTADRWSCGRSSNVAGMTISRVAGLTPDANYALKCQRIAGDASINQMYVDYAFATSEIQGFQGKQITVILDLITGANFSSAGSNISVSAVYGTGAQTRPSNGFTGLTGESVGFSVPPGQTVTRYSKAFALTVPANCTQMGLRINYAPVGVAGADDSFTVGRVQLEIGKAATQFEVVRIDDNLRRCMRYYQVVDSLNGITTAPPLAYAGYGAAGSNHSIYQPLMVPMNSLPTVTKVGAWTVANCGQPTITAGQTHVGATASITALGSFSYSNPAAALCYTLDARVI